MAPNPNKSPVEAPPMPCVKEDESSTDQNSLVHETETGASQEALLKGTQSGATAHPEKQVAIQVEDTAADVSSSGSQVSFSGCMQWLDSVQAAAEGLISRHRKAVEHTQVVLAVVLYLAYLIYASLKNLERATTLLVLTGVVILYQLYRLMKAILGKHIEGKLFSPVTVFIKKRGSCLNWVVYVLMLVAVILYLIISVRPEGQQWMSLVGLMFFLSALSLTSKHRSKICLRPVIWGLGIQFVLGIIVIRTQMGYKFFQFLGEKIQAFLSFSDVGARFVFGSSYTDHFFAFKVLPVVVYFSCAITVLYYFGAMQFIIGKIAWLMQVTMGTAATESLIAAGNIFIGQTEAPILVRPFIKDMTLSELHAMMTAGFATIAGGVMAAYILLGVPAEHLLCASVMNAPVALAVSKLSYPETENSTTIKKQIEMEKGKERNFLEAAAAGASASIKLVANIAVNLIAFIALLALVNALLSWLGSLVDHPEFDFMVLCSYLFMPIAYLMGVEWSDCRTVGKLLGMKTFINEFVAYEQLAQLINNRQQCEGPAISVRSEIITTYALCGFANLASVGVQLGGIGPMAPSRRADLASLAFRALICGTTACFITATVAGLLTVEEPSLGCNQNATNLLNHTLANSTDSILNATALPPVL